MRRGRASLPQMRPRDPPADHRPDGRSGDGVSGGGKLLAPVVRARKGEHTKILEDAQKRGFVRVRIDGELYELDDTPQLDKKKRHDIEIVVDRLIVRPSDEFRQRLADSMETAAGESGGRCWWICLTRDAAVFPELRVPGVRRVH